MSERMRDPDGAHGVAGQEALNVGLGRQRGRGDLEMRGLGIERLAAELAVEILRVFGRARGNG